MRSELMVTVRLFIDVMSSYRVERKAAFKSIRDLFLRRKKIFRSELL